MERNPTQNLSSPLLELHPCTFLFSSWEFPSSSSPPALVGVTATALIPQQTEQVFARVPFGEALMLLCQLDQRPAKLKDQKDVKKRNLCLAWAEPLGWEPAVRSGCGRKSWKVPVGLCGFKGSAVELCWPLGQAPPSLRNSCQHFPFLESKQNLNVKIFGGGQGIMECIQVVFENRTAAAFTLSSAQGSALLPLSRCGILSEHPTRLLLNKQTVSGNQSVQKLSAACADQPGSGRPRCAAAW